MAQPPQPLATSFAVAAVYLCSAPFPVDGSDSQSSSSREPPFAAAFAVFRWHLMTVCTYFENTFARVSSHLKVEASGGMNPVSSERVVVVVVVGPLVVLVVVVVLVTGALKNH